MKYDEVTILAGGYSARRYDVDSLPGYVIGVNGSALNARVDAALSMDRLFTEWAWPQLISLGVPLYLRDAALKNIPRSDWPENVICFKCDYQTSRLSDDARTPILNGKSSGLCAVGLGYQLVSHGGILWLCGLDGSIGPHGEKHWYADYEFKSKTGGPIKGTSKGKYAEWKRDLSDMIRQCKNAGIRVEMV